MMASNMTEDEDYHLEYIKRRRATIAARQAIIEEQAEVDQMEYDYLSKKKSRAESVAHFPNPSLGTSTNSSLPHRALARASPMYPTSTVSGGLPSGNHVDLTSPEPTSHSETTITPQVFVKKNRLSSKQVTEPVIGIQPARGSKRRRSEQSSDDVYQDEDDPSTTPAGTNKVQRLNEYRGGINETFPTVSKTRDGEIVEYRCAWEGCLANGRIFHGKFQFFRGIAGLSRHYRLTHDHPNYDENEVALTCVYRTLDEQQVAAVLREDTQGYKIEHVWGRGNREAPEQERIDRKISDVSSNAPIVAVKQERLEIEDNIPASVGAGKSKWSKVHGYRIGVNWAFPTVCKTQNGDFVEYRCDQKDCLANGRMTRCRNFEGFSGLVGLSQHYKGNDDHPNYSESDVALSCVYHKLDEQEIAAVLREDKQGYMIEHVPAKAPVKTKSFQPGTHELMSRHESAAEDENDAPAEDTVGETTAFQTAREKYLDKKMDGTTTLEEDEEFRLLRVKEKRRLQEVRDREDELLSS